MSYHYKMTLSIISKNAGPVTTLIPPHLLEQTGLPIDPSFMIGPSIIATHTPLTAPALDILFVPGGEGNVVLTQANDTWIEYFIASRFAQLDYVLSVCTGAVSLAKAGVLEGRRATTNKEAWGRIVKYGKNVTWVPSARWTEDGRVWTSSGVAAGELGCFVVLGEVSVLTGVGLDMTYAFMKSLYGDEVVDAVMNSIEYAPHTNPHWDPFSVVHNVSTVPIIPTRGNGLTIHRCLAQIKTCLCWILRVHRGIVSSKVYFSGSRFRFPRRVGQFRGDHFPYVGQCNLESLVRRRNRLGNAKYPFIASSSKSCINNKYHSRYAPAPQNHQATYNA